MYVNTRFTNTFVHEEIEPGVLTVTEVKTVDDFDENDEHDFTPRAVRGAHHYNCLQVAGVEQ